MRIALLVFSAALFGVSVLALVHSIQEGRDFGIWSWSFCAIVNAANVFADARDWNV